MKIYVEKMKNDPKTMFVGGISRDAAAFIQLKYRLRDIAEVTLAALTLLWRFARWRRRRTHR